MTKILNMYTGTNAKMAEELRKAPKKDPIVAPQSNALPTKSTDISVITFKLYWHIVLIMFSQDLYRPKGVTLS